MFKKSLALILSFVLIVSLSLVSLTAFAGSAAAGYCGSANSEDAYWEFDEETGVLTVAGTGDIAEDSLPKSAQTVIIGEGITGIPAQLFYQSSTLKSVQLPSTVLSIGDEAFLGCTSLESINLDHTAQIGEFAFYGCSALASLVIGAGVEQIGFSAFAGCINIETLTIADGVRFIDDNAFSGCSKFSGVIIPNSVTVMGCNVFGMCTALENVKMSDGMGYIPEYTFGGCCSLKCVILPNYRDITICRNAFAGCSSLSDVYYGGTPAEWSGGWDDYGTYVPYVEIESGNNALKNVTVHPISGGECTHVYISQTTEPTCMHGGYTQYTCMLCGYTYTDNATGVTAHTYGDWITTVPATCEYPGEKYRICSVCRNVEMADLDPLGHSAVSVVVKEPTVDEEGEMKSICTTCGKVLSTTVIPKLIDDNTEEPVYNFSYKSGDTIKLDSFYNEIKPYQQAGIPVHMSIEFNADTNEPISGGYDPQNYIKGFSVRNAESVTFSGIGPVLAAPYKAFDGNPVTELLVPDNLYSFDYGEDGDNYEIALERARRTGKPLESSAGEYMFSNCQKLEKATIDNHSDKMFLWAFYNCTALEKVVLTDKVTTISKGMFEGCTALKNIEIPSTVTKICDYAFYNTGLGSVYIPSNVKTIEPYALGYQDKEYIYEICTDTIDNYPDHYNTTQVEDFIIYGEPGSEAERYANENGFEFISSVEEDENKVYSAIVTKQAAVGQNAVISVNVSTGADKIQLINSEGKTTTYTRINANVKSIAADSSVTETWTINLKVYKPTETYNVKAKFGKTWTDEESVRFILNELRVYENKVYSAKADIPGTIGNYARLYVTVGGSPSKIQFRNSSGSTITYTRENANVIKIEADNVFRTEIWTVKLKVYKHAEKYTVAAKYNTGWSDMTVSLTLAELVKSQSDMSFRIVSHSDDYSSDDRLYITVPTGTKRIVSGNVYEGNTGYTVTREWVKANDHSGDLYDPGIGSSVNGKETWDLPNGAIYGLIDVGGELSYLSAEMADGSWVVKGYYGSETYNGYRYVPHVTMAETGSGTEPVKKVNSAEMLTQGEIGGYACVSVNAAAGASKICFVNSKGGTITFTRDSDAVIRIDQSGEDEIWAIALKVYRPTETYTVKAKYGREWTTDSSVQFTVRSL